LPTLASDADLASGSHHRNDAAAEATIVTAAIASTAARQ
jgi:hypothetical protein